MRTFYVNKSIHIQTYSKLLHSPSKKKKNVALKLIGRRREKRSQNSSIVCCRYLIILLYQCFQANTRNGPPKKKKRNTHHKNINVNKLPNYNSQVVNPPSPKKNKINNKRTIIAKLSDSMSFKEYEIAANLHGDAFVILDNLD